MLRAAVGRRGPGHVTGLLPAPWPRRFQAPPSDQPSRVGTLPPTGPSLAPDSASELGSSQAAVVRTPVVHSGQHPTCPAPPRLAPPPPPPLPAVGEPGATQRLACSPLARTRHLPGCGRRPRGSLPAARGPVPSRGCRSPVSAPPAAHRGRVRRSSRLPPGPTVPPLHRPPALGLTPHALLQGSGASAPRAPQSQPRVYAHGM